MDIFYICDAELEKLERRILEGAHITAADLERINYPENLPDDATMIPVDMLGIADDYDDIDDMIESLGCKGTVELFVKARERFKSNFDPQVLTAIVTSQADNALVTISDLCGSTLKVASFPSSSFIQNLLPTIRELKPKWLQVTLLTDDGITVGRWAPLKDHSRLSICQDKSSLPQPMTAKEWKNNFSDDDLEDEEESDWGSFDEEMYPDEEQSESEDVCVGEDAEKEAQEEAGNADGEDTDAKCGEPETKRAKKNE